MASTGATRINRNKKASVGEKQKTGKSNNRKVIHDDDPKIANRYESRTDSGITGRNKKKNNESRY